jgi:hypothetical protein
MTIKTFERPLIDLSHELVFKKAKLIDKEYKISIDDLSISEKSNYLKLFFSSLHSFDSLIQEYLDNAALDRSYAESEGFGGYDD